MLNLKTFEHFKPQAKKARFQVLEFLYSLAENKLGFAE